MYVGNSLPKNFFLERVNMSHSCCHSIPMWRHKLYIPELTKTFLARPIPDEPTCQDFLHLPSCQHKSSVLTLLSHGICKCFSELRSHLCTHHVLGWRVNNRCQSVPPHFPAWKMPQNYAAVADAQASRLLCPLLQSSAKSREKEESMSSRTYETETRYAFPRAGWTLHSCTDARARVSDKHSRMDSITTLATTMVVSHPHVAH